MQNYEQVFHNDFERRESQCCAVLINIVTKLKVNK